MVRLYITVEMKKVVFPDSLCIPGSTIQEWHKSFRTATQRMELPFGNKFMKNLCQFPHQPNGKIHQNDKVVKTK